VVRSRLLGLIRSIVGLTLVFDISDISRVSISDSVGDNLGTTIGKGYTVFARGSITITVLVLLEVGTRVVISNSIAILVNSWAIISGFRVSRLVGGSWVGNNSRFVDNGSGLVDGSRGGLVDWGRGGLVNWGRFVDRGWVVDRSGVVDGSMGMVDSMGEGMVSNGVSNGVGKVGSMVDSMGKVSMGWGVDGVVAGGMDSSDVFLLIVVLVNFIGSGGGLGVDSCVVTTMGFVNGGGDSGGVAVLDALVAVLVGGSQSQEG